MIYQIFTKDVKTKKDEYTVTYYLEIKRNSINVIYEFLGLYLYDYRRYVIKLNFNIRNEYIILENIMKNIDKVYSNFSETRRLAILSKYVIYVISKDLDIPLYKLIQKVQYESNGEVTELSINAFTKSTYRLISKFEKLSS